MAHKNYSPHAEAAMMSRRRFLRNAAMAGGGLSLAGLLAACGDSDDAATTTTAATASTSPPTTAAVAALAAELNLLGFPGFIAPNLISAFTELNPGVSVTEVSIDFSTSATTVAQIAQNADAFDMAFLESAGAGQANAGGLIIPIAELDVPNLANVPERIRSAFPFGWPQDTGQLGIAYRTDLVDDDIDTWEDFFGLASKYSGEILLVDFDRDVIGNALLGLGYNGNSTNPDEVAEAKDLILDIKPHVQAFQLLELGKSLVDGSASIVMGYDFETSAAIAENPDIRWVAPPEGLIAYVEGWVAVSESSQLDAVAALMDFGLSAEQNQEFYDILTYPDALASYDDPILEIADQAVFLEFLGEEGTVLWTDTWNEIKAG